MSYTIPKSSFTGSNPHLNYTTWFGNFTAHPYLESDIHATDCAGHLPFIFVDETITLQQWRLSRDPLSNLTMKMDVFPRKVDSHTVPGPRVDLRFDQGGLIGTGGWFLPQVAQHDFYIHTLEWDMSGAPSGTRTVWTYGEGPHRIEQPGTIDTFSRSVFMVGPVQSSPRDCSHTMRRAPVLHTGLEAFHQFFSASKASTQIYTRRWQTFSKT